VFSFATTNARSHCVKKHFLLTTKIILAVLAASGVIAGATGDAASSFTPIAGPLHDRGFAQIAIQVTDLDRAVRFYRDTLGLRYLFTTNGMVLFQVGEAGLMVEHGTPGRSVTLYFDDSNLERRRVRHLKRLKFSDPGANPLALIGNVKRKD
jgi:hypothetical protein